MAQPENNPITIRFHQTPYSRFYMCRPCRNHLLSSQSCLSKDVVLNGIICQNPSNVRADNVELRFLFYSRPVVDVYCNDCNRKLGYKFVMIAEPSRVVQEGRCFFYLDRMLYWNGNQVVYADTQQPVEDN